MGISLTIDNNGLWKETNNSEQSTGMCQLFDPSRYSIQVLFNIFLFILFVVVFCVFYFSSFLLKIIINIVYKYRRRRATPQVWTALTPKTIMILDQIVVNDWMCAKHAFIYDYTVCDIYLSCALYASHKAYISYI